jgi:hypothetical protein
MQRRLVVSCILLALAVPATAQNRLFDLEWLRLSGATWGGQVASEGSGNSVSGAGDVNGDGFDDFLVGAWTWDTANVDDAGRVYLVYGGLGVSGTQNLATGGAVFTGATTGTQGWNTGFAVSAAGDVNDDGFDDVLIGAPNASVSATSAGRVFLVYGSATLTGAINLLTFTGCVRIDGGNVSDLAGWALAGPGDVNDDGFDDVLVGAPGAENGLTDIAGAAYLVYGGNALPATISLGALGAGGVAIRGNVAGERNGDAVGAAGDVNGDGLPDLLVASRFVDLPGKVNAGRAWIVYGSTTLPASLTLNALGSAGVIINGHATADDFGTSITGGGDVNGDGRDDILVGAPLADTTLGGGDATGRTYLIHGSTSFPATIEASNVGGSVAGVLFQGIDTDDRSGNALGAGGDVNGDGYADLLIAARNGDPNGDGNAGEVYLIHGSPSLPTPFALSAINARGVVLTGVTASDAAGTGVAFAGDLNGDGFTEALVGAPGGDPPGGSAAGETVALNGGCHLIQALGPVAEGGLLVLRAHGTPNVSNLTFASVLAVGQPPFGPQPHVNTPFGPWWLISQIVLFPFSFAANGEMAISLAMPAPGAVAGLLGLEIYMQTLGQPQGNQCDLTTLLGFTVE